MAAESPPYVVQGGSHPATLFRQAICTLQGNRSGVVGLGDLKVKALASPGMAVTVAGGVPGGQAWIKGTTTEGPQGSYYGYNNAQTELAVVAAGAKKRIDSPIAQVKDAQYAGSENTYSLSVLKGTESESPVEPSLPASSMRLANFPVEPSTTKIENAAITDKRVILGTGDTYLEGTFAERPSAGVLGREYYATDRKAFYKDTGSEWIKILSPNFTGPPTKVEYTKEEFITGAVASATNYAFMNFILGGTAVEAAHQAWCGIQGQSGASHLLCAETLKPEVGSTSGVSMSAWFAPGEAWHAEFGGVLAVFTSFMTLTWLF